MKLSLCNREDRSQKRRIYIFAYFQSKGKNRLLLGPNSCSHSFYPIGITTSYDTSILFYRIKTIQKNEFYIEIKIIYYVLL